MNLFLHIQPKEGRGFLMIREGAHPPSRLTITTGQDGARLDREEAQSLQRAVERWLKSQEGKEVEP